jgi:hypothetical protein
MATDRGSPRQAAQAARRLAPTVAAVERDLLLVKITLAMIVKGEAVNATDASACQQAATRIYQVIVEARGD